MNRYLQKLFTKVIQESSKKLRSFYYRRILYSWMDFGPNIHFSASLECLGVTGHVAIGANTFLGSHLSISVAAGGEIIVGRNCSLNKGTVVSALKSVRIGNGARIGENVSIRDNDHRIDGRHPIRESGFKIDSVVIGEDVWIGRNATIMPGCTVGRGAIVAAHSFVRHDVPAFAVVAGTPAKIIKYR